MSHDIKEVGRGSVSHLSTSVCIGRCEFFDCRNFENLMAKCSVLNCLNSVINCPEGVTFHRFPKDEPRRQKWIRAVQRKDWSPSAYSVLCSAHFFEEDVDRTSLMCVRIRQDAVPNVFKSVPRYLQKGTKSRQKKTTGRTRKQQVGKRAKIYQDYREKYVENDSSMQNPECLIKVCDVRTCEPALGPDMSTTTREEDNAREQTSVPNLLEKCEVDSRTEQNTVAHVLQQYDMTTCAPVVPVTGSDQPVTMMLGLVPLGTCVPAPVTMTSPQGNEPRDQKPMELPGECNAGTCETVLTSKCDYGANGQQQMAKVLGLIAVGTGEAGQTISTASEGEDCVREQKPVAVLLGLIAVGTGEPAPGPAVAPVSNCTMTESQTVFCAPDIRSKMSFKRMLGQEHEQEMEAPRKMSRQETDLGETWNECNQVLQFAPVASTRMPEADLLQQYKAGTLEPTQALSITNSCTMLQDSSVLSSLNCPHVSTLNRKLCQANEQLCIASKKIKQLSQGQRRSEMRILSLKSTLSDLRSKNFQAERITMPKNDVSVEMFDRHASKMKGTSLSTRCSSQLREFATKLFCYSPDAYNYMRNAFRGCLPHPQTIQRWDNPCMNDSSV